jgi:hypothetical protein
VDSYLLENNVWGKGEITNYSQCVYVTGNNKFGWHWDWPYSGSNVKAYPEVIFGKKPWQSQSTHPLIPAKLSAIETFTIDFDLDMSAQGIYNLAFEFWVTRDSLSDGSDITTEVMIWMDQSSMTPAGTLIDTLSIDGFSYYLYQANWSSWTYFAFLSETKQYQGLLNVHQFINYMINQGLLNPNEYFASFELGNEVIQGNGATDIQQYEVKVNGAVSGIVKRAIPSELILHQNYPNPFNPYTTIEFYLPKTSDVSLKIFNILGEEVATLVSDRLTTGKYSYKWSRPAGIASGVYLYRLDVGEFVETSKMVLMR